MRSHWANYTVAIILALVVGLHWTMVQSLAWVGMVVTYSRTASIHEALTKTFDGQHPCSMCKLVKKGLAGETKRTSQNLITKTDFILQCAPELLSPPLPFSPVDLPLPFALLRIDTPPTPPPRQLTA